MIYDKKTNTIGEIACHSSCKDLWEDGKDYKEGVDYEIEQWCNNKETLNGVDTFVQKYKYGTTMCSHCYIIAYPHKLGCKPIIYKY